MRTNKHVGVNIAEPAFRNRFKLALFRVFRGRRHRGSLCLVMWSTKGIGQPSMKNGRMEVGGLDKTFNKESSLRYEL